MKQDNGNHAATPGPLEVEHLAAGIAAQFDRLEAINAELVTALRAVVATGGLDGANLTNSLAQARFALAKAREEGRG